MLLFNNAIGGFIRLFNDIARKVKQDGTDPKRIDELLSETKYYLDPLQSYFRSMSAETKKLLRSSYGGNGPRDYWRNLEKAIHEAHNDFLPDGYEKYWADHDKSHNDDCIRIMTDVEKSVRTVVRSAITTQTEKWVQEVPPATYKAASTLQSKHKYDTCEDVDLWEFIPMAGFQSIITYGNHWTTIFEKAFTRPSEEKKTGGKMAKTEWMITIDKLQKNAGKATFNVTAEEYAMLQEVEKMIPFAIK